MTALLLELETVKSAVALTKSPAWRFERADLKAEALETSMVRVGENAGRVCVYEIAWSYVPPPLDAVLDEPVAFVDAALDEPFAVVCLVP